MATQANAPPVTAPVSVLLVDDDEPWAQATARLVEANEPAFDVIVATSLEEGRSQFESVDPECLICDYQLGDGTGLELLDTVRDIDADRPFLLLTGQGDETVASQAIDRGVSDYIAKIHDDDESNLLTARVTKAVTSYRTHQQLVHERQTKASTLSALTATTDSTEIASQFCRLLITNHGFAAAWIGTVDDNREIVPVAVDGCESYLDTIFKRRSQRLESASVSTHTPETQDPAIAASQINDEVVTEFSEPSTDGVEPTIVDGLAHEEGFKTGAGIPITHDGIQVGVLGVYSSTRGSQIDSQMRPLLDEYAEIIGYAYRTEEWERSLWSDRPVHLTVKISDATVPLVGLSSRLGDSVTATVLSTNRAAANKQLYLMRISGTTADDVRTAVETSDTVELGNVSTLNDAIRCDLYTTRSTPEQLLGANGAQVEHTTVTDGGVTMSVSVDSHSAVSVLTSALNTAYDSVTLSSPWNQPEDVDTARLDDPLHTLTQKQLEVLKYAYFDGYFEQPRNVSSVELSEKFGLARSTMTQHMRTAQQKVFEHLFEK